MIATHLSTAVLAVLLMAVSWIDVRTMRIPDLLNLAVGASGLAVTWLLGGDLFTSLLGVVIGYLLLLGAHWAYRLVRGRDGLGLGDAKLLAGAGAWIGWSGLPFVILIASATGIALVAAARLAGQQIAATDQVPFGPFLAAATMLVWLVQTYV